MKTKKYVSPSVEVMNFYLENEVAYQAGIGSQGGGDQWSKKREVNTNSTSSSIWGNSINNQE